MKRFRLLAALLCAGALCSGAAAQEIYKWTDANGRVHYGDRAAAPESSRKMSVAAPAPARPAAVSPPGAGALRRDPQRKSTPVDPALVPPACKGLIEQIAAVPPGKNWESLYRQFDSACPGIAYECREYRSRPQDNLCGWVERSGSSVLNRNRYP